MKYIVLSKDNALVAIQHTKEILKYSIIIERNKSIMKIVPNDTSFLDTAFIKCNNTPCFSIDK